MINQLVFNLADFALITHITTCFYATIYDGLTFHNFNQKWCEKDLLIIHKMKKNKNETKNTSKYALFLTIADLFDLKTDTATSKSLLL